LFNYKIFLFIDFKELITGKIKFTIIDLDHGDDQYNITNKYFIFFCYRWSFMERLPRSKNTGWFRQESTGNRWNVEAVFPPENFQIFFDDFRPVLAEKHRELTGIHRKKYSISSGGNTGSTSGYFQCFPTGSGDLPASFLQDPAGSGSRNH
jgi:hypothetical protein